MSSRYIRRKRLQQAALIAREHAEWWVEVVIPMMIPVIKVTAETMFIHGYKHRMEEEKRNSR